MERRVLSLCTGGGSKYLFVGVPVESDQCQNENNGQIGQVHVVYEVTDPPQDEPDPAVHP